MCECIEIRNRNEAKAEFARRLVNGDTVSALGIAQSIWIFFGSEEEFSTYVNKLIKTADAVLPAETTQSFKQDLLQLSFQSQELLLAA